VLGVAFSPDGKWIASTQAHGPACVRIWDARSGRLARTLEGLPSWPITVAFSPDGKHIAAGTGNVYIPLDPPGEGRIRRVVKIWAVDTGTEVLTLPARSPGVWHLAFSPDGRRLAAATGDYQRAVPGDVKVWDARTGQELFTLRGHAHCVWNVGFSPDGKRLASASGPRTNSGRGKSGEVKVWDMATGQEVLSLREFDRAALGVAFSPDGHHLAASSADGTVRVWDGTPLAEAPVPEPQIVRK
jgi:WD40 repeat protein